MKNKGKKKNHIDKSGREFIKDSYFVGWKIKFRRTYVIGVIPADEFYKKNATELDLYLNQDFELNNSKSESNNHFNE